MPIHEAHQFLQFIAEQQMIPVTDARLAKASATDSKHGEQPSKHQPGASKPAGQSIGTSPQVENRRSGGRGVPRRRIDVPDPKREQAYPYRDVSMSRDVSRYPL